MSSRETSPTRASEQTPLLSRTTSHTEQQNGHIEQSAPSKRKTRWPIVAAIAALSAFMLTALILGFAMPSAVESYVKQAVEFEADNVAIESFTNTGIRAHIQGTVWFNASKVLHKPTRDLGRFATWVAGGIESGETVVKVYLPDYEDAYVGQAIMPPVKLNIRNGKYNWIDKIVDLEPGDPQGIRRVADDLMHK